MRLAGTSSWRMEVKDGSLCRLALFVRESAGLEIVRPTDDIPPLTGSVSSVGAALDTQVRRDASDQWRSWWAQVLAHEFRDRPVDDGDRDDPRARARRRMAEYEAVYDPPKFDALADRPALRAAVTTSYPAFRQWESAQPAPPRIGLSGSSLDWALMKQTAEDVAFDRQVDIGAVQAMVGILPVHGVWWRRVAPGCVLCSPAAAVDPKASQALLHDAFDSYVTRRA